MRRRVVKVINTRKRAERRTLRFSSLHDIVADAASFDASTVRGAGNWTAAQIVAHVAKLIRFSAQGFPPATRAPWPVRVLGRPFKKFVLSRTFRPGIKLPAGLRILEPDADVTWEEAGAELREAVATAEAIGMTQRSPVLGPLTHEEWVKLHCRHAEMHFSFLQEGEGRPLHQTLGR